MIRKRMMKVWKKHRTKILYTVLGAALGVLLSFPVTFYFYTKSSEEQQEIKDRLADIDYLFVKQNPDQSSIVLAIHMQSKTVQDFADIGSNHIDLYSFGVI